MPTISLKSNQGKVYQSPARFRVLAAGRRFGKTSLAIPELLRWAWGPDTNAWYIAPTYKQAKMIAWEKLKTIAEPWIVKTNESELSVRLVSGGTIRLHGAENYDRLRGPGLNGVVFDEFADIDVRAWQQVVRPMLSDRHGSALFIGTPKGFNHFREMYNTAKSGTDPSWAAWQFTTLQGGYVDPAEVEAARLDQDEKTWRQEYEASFENLTSGRVYYAFDREKNCRLNPFNPADGPLIWSHDFNISPMCSVLCQEHISNQWVGTAYRANVSVLDEIVLNDSNVWEACQEFERKTEPLWRRYGVLNVKIYGDATGGSRQHATGGSSYDMIREFFRTRHQYRVSYNINESNPPIRDRVNAMNSKICTVDGLRTLYIDPKCQKLINDLEQVIWKIDANGNATGQPDQKDGLTHISDALGYYVEYEYGLTRSGSIGYQPGRLL